MRPDGVHARLRITHASMMVLLWCTCSGWSVQLPTQAFEDLGSTEFHRRELAQNELLVWGRKQPELAKTEFLKQARNAVDPEVRERCMGILRSLVTDEYLKEGEGYIGIALALQDEVLTIPGDSKPRNAIRVLEVREDTPGQRAGIRLNDLIVGLEGERWSGTDASPLFREKVKTMKPNSNAKVSIIRDGELVEINVRLGRRPLMADMFFNGLNVDPAASERAAMESYFRRWLSQNKQRK
jgi:hypothetical protein